MKITLLIVFITSSLLCHGNKVIDSSKESVQGEFQHTKIVTSDVYKNRLPSGCESSLTLHNDESLFFTYGGPCLFESKPIDSIDRIARSIRDIIMNYSLVHRIKKRKYLYISISGIVPHYYLVKRVNESEEWPINILNYLSKERDEDAMLEKYKHMLAEELTSKGVYGQIVENLEKFDCRVQLNENYADPLYFYGNLYSKDYLIENDVFTKDEITKELYPKIFGQVVFNMMCYE